MRRIAIMAMFSATFSAAIAASPAGAQSLLDGTMQVGPQFHSFDIGGDAGQRITQLVLPVSVTVPMFSRLSLEIASAYAKTEVSGGGTPVSSISGLTDTQVRASYVFGEDAVVFTAGFNFPTGSSQVSADEAAAAGQIGNDFFGFPISNMGTGLAATAGLGVARPFGMWNVGAGLSARHSSEYEPFDTTLVASPMVYQPGDEYRARLGLDRSLLAGRVAFGATYSMFGSDIAGSSTYSTGDRLVVQAAYAVPVGGVDMFFSGWNLYRMEGERADGIAPPENITNMGLSAGVRTGRVRWEPNAEVRHSYSDGESRGTIVLAGLRAQFPVGRLAVFPGAGFAVGSYAPRETKYDVTGWRATLAIRLAR